MCSNIFPPLHIRDLILLIPEECVSVEQKINVGLDLTDVLITLLVFGSEMDLLHG